MLNDRRRKSVALIDVFHLNMLPEDRLTCQYHHKLINDDNEDQLIPVKYMAEACLRLCYGDPKILTGRIDYADEVIEEFSLKPADLL